MQGMLMSDDWMLLALPLLTLFVTTGLWWSYHQIAIDRTIREMNEVRRHAHKGICEELYALDRELLSVRKELAETQKDLAKERQFNAAAQVKIDDLNHAFQDSEHEIAVMLDREQKRSPLRQIKRMKRPIKAKS